MVLIKDEFLSMLRTEVRILLHLMSKIEPEMLDYRPTSGQRSLLELLRYLTLLGPIHARGVRADGFSMEGWGKMWTEREPAAKAMDLEAVRAAIAGLPAVMEEIFGGCTDADMRETIEMFGHKNTRGAWAVNLVLSHYTAYRMQLFLYLKACGRPELSTLNLWAGIDG